MGTTFVTADGERGFWMRDGLLELFLRLLALHLEEPREPGAATVIRDAWLLASRGWFTGCVPHGLEDAVRTDEGRALVRGAIGSLRAALASAPPALDAAVLNLLGMEGRWEAPIETERLVEISQAFVDLLDGKIDQTARDTRFMPGSRR